MPDTIVIPRHKPGPRPVTVPNVKTSVRILGQAQVDMWQAMCAAAGRRPHELAADIIHAAIRAEQADPVMRELAAAIARGRRHLTVVRGDTGSSQPGRSRASGTVRRR